MMKERLASTKPEFDVMGKKIKCPHCNYVWKYKGKKKAMVQCQDCRKYFELANAGVADD